MRASFALLAGVLLVCVSEALAVNIETVPVGNPGNAGELSGNGAGGAGPDRVCGAVDYTYNIGKYEVTAGQYTVFLNKVGATDTHGLYNTNMWLNSRGCKIQRSGTSGSYTYSVADDWADRPVNYVSYWDACRFTNWLHNGQPTGAQGAGTTETGAYTLDGYNGQDGQTIQRNPGWNWAVTSEDEWYKAAYHMNDGASGNYFDYPTSSNTAPGYVNDSGNLSTTGHPFVGGGIDPGNYATYDGDGGNDGVGSPYYRSVVGEWENSDSPYGTFDQGGNVVEWNESEVNAGSEYSYYSTRGLRGTSFPGDSFFLLASGRFFENPTLELDLIGFRVSEVPEPSMMATFTLAFLPLLRRRR